MALSNEAMESMLKAMDIIAGRKVDKVSYDSTIICTIVNNDDRKNGCYIVTDGTIKFKAYSGVTNYKVDEQVRVSVPNGDYTQDKYIEGKYVSDNNTSPITYVSPLESVVDMASLIISNTSADITGSLVANKPDSAWPKGIALWDASFNAGDGKADFKDLQENSIYDTIFLKADFRSLLNNKKMRSGTYGLRLDLSIRTNSKNHPYIIKSLYLDSSEMFGNPYSFTVFSTQEKKFDIVGIGIIDKMTLYFYQNNDFSYYNGKEVVTVPIEVDAQGQEVANLFVQNISLGFGSDIAAVPDNTVQLYSSDSMDFKHYTPTDETNLKDIGFLWYNKTEENQYIGFSDGVVTYDDEGQLEIYDEIQYLNKSEQDSRLTGQKGKKVPTDQVGLDASASIEEAEPILKATTKLITNDLSNTLRAFRDRLRGLGELQNEISSRLQTDKTEANTELGIDNLPDLSEALEIYTDGIIEYFTKQLEFAAAIQANKKDGTEIPDGVAAQTNRNYWTSIQGIFTNLNKTIYNKAVPGDKLVDFLPTIRTEIASKYQGFQGIYDTYATRVSKIFTSLAENESKLNTLLNGKEALIAQYGPSYTFNDYTARDFSHYDNRYCVYWYRYVKGYVDTEERFMENGWQRFTPDYRFVNSQKPTTATLPENTGLPSKVTQDGTTFYLDKKPAADEGTLSIYLDPNSKEEKFVVIVFYNHEMYKSEELVFTNADAFEDLSIDGSDAIYIEHGQSSLETYQNLYGSTNFLTNSRDAHTVRQLRARYNGTAHKDEALAGAHIYWYVPNNTTMIKVDPIDLKNKGFSTDYDQQARVTVACKSRRGPNTSYSENSKSYAVGDIVAIYEQNNGYYSLKSNNLISNTSADAEWISGANLEIIHSEYHRDGYTCFYKQIGSKEVTVEEWDADLEENVEVKKITCEEADTYFYYKIQEYYTPTFLRNIIYCHVEKEEYPFEADLTLVFGTLGTSGTDYTLMVVPSTTQTAVQTSKNLPLTVNLYDYNNEPIDMYAKYDSAGAVTNIAGAAGQAFDARVTWMGPSTFNLNLLIDEGDKTVYGGEAILSNTEVTSDKYCGIAKVVTSFGLGAEGEKEVEANTENKSSNKKYRQVDLTTLYPIAWSIGDYYIEGATSIVYDAYGQNPNYYKDPYKIYKANTNDELIVNSRLDENNVISKVEWVITSFVGNDGDLAPTVLNADHAAYKMYSQYMPVINDKNGLTPCNMYLNDMACYPVVQCYITVNNDSSTRTLFWSQPIAIIQNRYPSPMLNSWDGSLTIDEKNGTILSSMIGAGGKTADNTFQGVLMGDIAGSAGFDLENKTGYGVYGFNDGAQSFGLNIDGTAFFGKSGRGRIKIDGDKGTITSASYEQLKNTGDSGMLIDLDDGIIDMYGVDQNGVNDNNAPNYKVSDTHPHIRLSTTASPDNPYFLITTPNAIYNADNEQTNWDGKELIYIGLDKYFLQSENYIEGIYSTTDGSPNLPGAGTMIDLQNGRLDAYNLKITSKNIYMDSTENANPYFVIKDDHGHNLFYTGTDEYYLKTCNYNPRTADENDTTTAYGSGIKIDLWNNNIDAYDFMIRGESSSETTGGSYILLDSITPQFVMHLKKPGTDPLVDLDLIKVSASEFMLHSANWNVITNTDTTEIKTATCASGYNVRSGPGTDYSIVGTTGSSSKTVTIYEQSEGTGSEMWYRIGENEWVANGAISNIQTSSGGEQASGSGMEINMNSGCITAYNSGNAGKNLIINSGAAKYPIQLGTINKYNLKLGWDGSLQGGTTYTWSITSSGKATFNSMTVNSGSFNGYIYASGGTIGGCKISSGSISGTGWSLTSEVATFNGINLISEGKTHNLNLTTSYIHSYLPNTTIVNGTPTRTYVSSASTGTLNYLQWDGVTELPAGITSKSRTIVTGYGTSNFATVTYKLAYVGYEAVKEQ